MARRWLRQFQFHKGTIRTFIKKCEEDHISNFNSIKVQLEQFRMKSLPLSIPFQFHKGTIRTLLSFLHPPGWQPHFNSIKVQLEHQLRHINVLYQPYFNSIKVQLEPAHFLNCSTVRGISIP